ncbi:MAG: hypothetical protein ACR2PK_09565, partial [Acidimicrobiales bacterium]
LLGGLGPGVSPARQLCGKLRSTIEYGDVAASLDNDGAVFITEIEAGLVQLGEVIARYAFNPAHSPSQHAQFVRPGAEVE